MHKDLDQKLCEKYPLIFRDRHEDPSKTCMYWGLSVGDGWYDLLDKLCALIQGHIDWRIRSIELTKKFNEDLAKDAETNFEDREPWMTREPRAIPEPIEQVVAIQVKEKFGGLRFYYNGGDEYIRGLTTMAEEMSYRICEVCSDKAAPTQGGWIRTLCEKHSN